MTADDYRPGLEGVVAGETAISTIAGGLQYRGYSIDVLADQASFEETAYLVLFGELPTAEELNAFRNRLARSSSVPAEVLRFLRSVPNAAPLMDVLRTATSMLAHWDPDAADNSHEANVRKTERLIAQIPVIVAARYRISQDKEPVGPDSRCSFAENVLRMLLRQSPDQRAVRAMDVSLILYMEHEFNASTFSARVVCSTLSDLHSSITAAIGALKGPLHGGANERVLRVLEEIGSAERAESWVREAFEKKVRIMGFGHRVYKQGDPRATYLKQRCAELAEQAGKQEMEIMAETIERIVREEKGLPPNLDWPSARLYHYLGLPVELYTPLFVVSRVVGWCAHVIEQLDNNRLIRPRSRYTGPSNRPWQAIADR
ncbi:MAG: citrate/2-methylcitrate synthase [Pirellulales bacterium]